MASELPRTILDSAHNAFVSLDADGRVLEWNRRAEALFAYSREEALGRELAELVVPERYRARHREGLRRALRRGTATAPLMQVEALRRDGTEFPVDATVLAVQEGDEIRFHGWIQDVSERAELLRELTTQLQGDSPGFRDILEALAEAVTIRDPHHHIIYANRAALSHMGFDSLEDMQRRPPSAILKDYEVHDEHGRELRMDDIPSVRMFAGQKADPLVMRTIHRESGEIRWQLLKASGLRDSDGRLVATVTIIEDITREKTSALRERFLARATQTLMSSLDYEETLRNVAALAVPELADWCTVDLVDERGRIHRVAVAHPDGPQQELADRLQPYTPQEPDPESGLARVLRTGVSELHPDIGDALLAQAASSDQHLELLRQLEVRSALMVPLRSRERTLGVVTLVTAQSRRRLGPDDLEFAEALAGRAAVAVENARLATARHQTAATLQRSLIPEVIPDIGGWEIATMYRAATTSEEVEVGGDFYDFVRTDGGWMVLLGDVTGKGVEAAAMTSLVRHGARFLGRGETSPSRILEHLNGALREEPGMWLCTAVCARLLSDRVVVSAAGHPPPLLVGCDGEIREIDVRGPILGAWRDPARSESSVPIADGETLFLYTDGVVDIRGEEDRFGFRRLRSTLSQRAGASPQDLLSGLETTLEDFQSRSQVDDTAAVALRRAGSSC